MIDNRFVSPSALQTIISKVKEAIENAGSGAVSESMFRGHLRLKNLARENATELFNPDSAGLYLVDYPLEDLIGDVAEIGVDWEQLSDSDRAFYKLYTSENVGFLLSLNCLGFVGFQILFSSCGSDGDRLTGPLTAGSNVAQFNPEGFNLLARLIYFDIPEYVAIGGNPGAGEWKAIDKFFSSDSGFNISSGGAVPEAISSSEINSMLSQCGLS